MKAIIAVNNHGYIGKGVKLLWYNKEDLQHFKRLTMDSRCLAGFITYHSLPNLKNREVILDYRDEFNFDVDWCIGGKKTYEKYAPYFTELHISHINNNDIGDITFPNLSKINQDCKTFLYNF